MAVTFKRILAYVFASTFLFACNNVQPTSEKLEDRNTLIEQLVSFDENSKAYKITADSAVFGLVNASANQALAVTFDDNVKISSVNILPKAPLDWSDKHDFNLAVDLKNPTDHSLYFYMGLHDADGNFQNKGMNVPANSEGTFYVILDGPTRDIDGGMRELPAPWTDGEKMMIARWTSQGGKFDFSSVSKISFFTRGIVADKSVEIDNIRLRKNRPHPANYMQGIVDKFGQNAHADFPIKVSSESELRQIATDEISELKINPGMADRSKFGGWIDGPKLEATGNFRVEKYQGKWWMVDPEGYLFFSHGVANVRMANLSTMTGVDYKDDVIRKIDADEVTPEDSIGIVNVTSDARKAAYVSSKQRRNMFEWLPAYDSDFADHYSYRRSVHMGPMESGETYNFYRANLKRRYGETYPESYMNDWVEVTLDRMNSWGFTSFGNWVDPKFYPNEQVPYFANGWIIGDYQTLSSGYDIWGPTPDFFDPKFSERAVATISKIAEEIKGSPWCVGVFIDNEKSWGNPDDPDEKRYGLIMDALSRSTESSFAKTEFSRQLKKKYVTIDALNSAWTSSYPSWSDFDAGIEIQSFNDNVVSDLSDLFAHYSEQYFKIVSETLETYLPNHLYMGARMASWGMPEETIKAAINYSDVMSFNIYEEGLRKGGWDFFKEIDKPVVIGEFHIGAISDTGLHHPGLVMAADQADRAKMYKAYMETVTTNPYLVGAHWFQYVDSPLTGRAFDGENYNVGFVSTTDIPYPDMVNAAKDVNRDLYPKRFSLP